MIHALCTGSVIISIVLTLTSYVCCSYFFAIFFFFHTLETWLYFSLFSQICLRHCAGFFFICLPSVWCALDAFSGIFCSDVNFFLRKSFISFIFSGFIFALGTHSGVHSHSCFNHVHMSCEFNTKFNTRCSHWVHISTLKGVHSATINAFSYLNILHSLSLCLIFFRTYYRLYYH